MKNKPKSDLELQSEILQRKKRREQCCQDEMTLVLKKYDCQIIPTITISEEGNSATIVIRAK